MDDNIENPIESEEYPGFFVSPPFPEVLVSRDGEILRIGRHRPHLVGTTTYGSDSHGYRTINTWCGERHRRRAVKVHRIVAHAFKRRSSPDQILVNHKNGIRDDNRYDNIEWCTQSENVRHALLELENGMQLTPVKIKDLSNNTITEYRGMQEAANAIGVSVSAVSKSLLKTTHSCVLGRYLIKYSDSKEPWPNIKLGDVTTTVERPVLAWNVATDMKVIYRGVSDAARHTGVSLNVVWKYVTKKYKHLVKDWVFVYYHDVDKLPTKEEILLASANWKRKDINRLISYKNLNTGEVGECTIADMAARLKVEKRYIRNRVASGEKMPYYGYWFKETYMPWPDAAASQG